MIEKVKNRILPDSKEFCMFFSPDFAPFRPQLFTAADELRKQSLGDDVYLRGLVEFSNYCSCGCAYCGISWHNKSIQRYRMSSEEIFETVKYAFGLGFRSFVLQSGEDKFYDERTVVKILDKLKNVFDCAITLSIGEWSKESLRNFRCAGADRYLLRIETSDPDLFSRLHPDSKWDDRHRCLQDIKELGFQTGSGILIGLPGQGPESLYQDFKYLLALDPEMVGVGPFIPHPETPLKNEKCGDLDTTLTFLALLRLFLPRSFLPATTAMGSIHPEGRKLALLAGANVLMPNVSPTENRAMYELYPGKICITDDALKCHKCMESWVSKMNRRTNLGKGHIIKDSSKK
ncbi:MAG: [FeFe] hydrogenase H-cluster radical SAM maturase HydE [Candidatus Riflebacteria bacterium]|nr:[FeFe] hydrogenase H-cluster radical SAM maturase HydE [Candidatus Riflebacteria bacterium]